MASIWDLPAPWRHRLMPASFKGAEFHVEDQTRSSGRRTVTHEYPKRNPPYAEDMGRHAKRYQVTGYVIGPEYHIPKQRLIDALESDGSGRLVDPYVPNDMPQLFMCERYSVSERREMGGYAVFEMLFVEAGTPGNLIVGVATADMVQTSANQAATVAENNVNQAAPAISRGGAATLTGV